MNTESVTLSPYDVRLGSETNFLINHRNIKKINHRKCGAAAKTRITGGEKAFVGQFPWLALIRFTSKDVERKLTFGCGGSLISMKHVLTAAHCIAPDGYRMWVSSLSISDHQLLINNCRHSVRLGEHTISTNIDCDNLRDLATCNIDDPPIQDIDIARTVVHERYDRHLKRNDIALIHLLTDVKFKGVQNVQTICLPVRSAQMIDNLALEERMPLKMSISGWGYTETNQRISDVLMHALVPYINQTECATRVASLRSRTSALDFEVTDTVLVNFECLRKQKSNRHLFTV